VAGGTLRCKKKIGDFGPRFHALMREKGIRIKPQMITALHEMPAANMGQLLVETLIKNQIELSSRVEIVGAVGKMMLRLGNRDQQAIKKFFMVAALAIKDADIDCLVQYIEKAAKVSNVETEAALYRWLVKAKNMDMDQAVSFLAEIDNVRVYDEEQTAQMLQVPMFEAGSFIGKYAAIRFYNIKQTVALAKRIKAKPLYNTNHCEGSRAVEVFVARGFKISTEAIRFIQAYVLPGPAGLEMAAILVRHFSLRLFKSPVNTSSPAYIGKVAKLLCKLITRNKGTKNEYDFLQICQSIKMIAVWSSPREDVYSRLAAEVIKGLDLQEAEILQMGYRLAKMRGYSLEKAGRLLAGIADSLERETGPFIETYIRLGRLRDKPEKTEQLLGGAGLITS